MKTKILSAVILTFGLGVSALAQDTVDTPMGGTVDQDTSEQQAGSTPIRISNTVSNTPFQPTAILPVAPPDTPDAQSLTNLAQYITAWPIFPVKEIKLTAQGALADYGQSTVTFAADISDSMPIRIVAPDGKIITARPTWIVLENRRTGENQLVATITNSIGLTAGSEVIYTNAFDTIDASIRYVYGDNFLEQFITLQSDIAIPEEWLKDAEKGNLSVQCWTEFIDSEPLALQSTTTLLRAESADAPSVEADDTTTDFGVLKLGAGGRAFAIGEENNSIAAVKSWVDMAKDSGSFMDKQNVDTKPRRFLIESFDYFAAKQSLSKLKKGKGHAAIQRINSSRSMFASNAKRGPRSLPGTKMFAVQNWKQEQVGFELDWQLAGCVSMPANVLGYWMAEGNTVDSVGGLTGTAYNGANYAGGKVVNGFNLNGSSQHIRITDTPSLHLTSSMTVEAWIYPTAIGNWQNPVSKWEAATQNPEQKCWALTLIPDGHFAFGLSTNGHDSGSATAMSSSVLPTYQWTHVAGTFDGIYIRLFINGVCQSQVYFPGTMFPGTEDIGIGATVGGAAPGVALSPWYGKIDEVTLYSRGLLTNEILAIYNAGIAGKCYGSSGGGACATTPYGVVGWWPGDGTTNDISRSHPATSFGGLAYVNAQYAQGFSLDGVDDYGKVSRTSDLDVGTYNGMSVEAWVKPLDNAMRPVVEWSDTSKVGVHVWVNYPGSGNVYANITDTSGTIHTTYGTGLSMNAFNHIAAVYNKSQGTLAVYVNGVSGTPNYVGSFTPETTLDFYVGHRPIYGQEYFKGTIDELTVYQKALDSYEVSAIYNAGYNGKCRGTYDSDGDGIPDWWERLYFSDLSRSSVEDADGDGLSNMQEYNAGTSPTNSDSDLDGVPDGTEVIQGRSPTVPGAVLDTNQIGLQIYTPIK